MRINFLSIYTKFNIMNMERIIDRFSKYMELKRLNNNRVTVDCGLSVGLIGQAKRGKCDLGHKAIERILSTYIDINRVWLLTGDGHNAPDGLPPSATAAHRTRRRQHRVCLHGAGITVLSFCPRLHGAIIVLAPHQGYIARRGAALQVA